ncbi:MAG: hypothetical protein ACLR2M_06280 [Varibaculum sp.]
MAPITSRSLPAAQASITARAASSHTLTPDKLTISIFLQQFDEVRFQRQGTGDRLLLVFRVKEISVALRSARMVSKSSSSTTSGAGISGR